VRNSTLRASQLPKEAAVHTTERSEGSLRGPTCNPANEVTFVEATGYRPSLLVALPAS
jgi:hypothetical protein